MIAVTSIELLTLTQDHVTPMHVFEGVAFQRLLANSRKWDQEALWQSRLRRALVSVRWTWVQIFKSQPLHCDLGQHTFISLGLSSLTCETVTTIVAALLWWRVRGVMTRNLASARWSQGFGDHRGPCL